MDTPHQTLGEIKSLLAAHGLRPRHRFGQNFLHDAGKLDQIIEAAQVKRGEVVLEVGPGTGALSVPLLAKGARLVAVEIDRDLEPLLRAQPQAAGGEFELIIADVLAGKHEINPRVVAALGAMARQADGPPRYKLIANLPYNIASPLLVNLLLLPYDGNDRPRADTPVMSRGVVTVQREVADRLAAPPGGKDYGPLSVMTQVFCAVKRLTTLPPSCFWPRPKVESAVVTLSPRVAPLTDRPHRLAAVVHRLFNQRRKQLGSILGRNAPLPRGIEPTARPQTLTVEQWVELAASCG